MVLSHRQYHPSERFSPRHWRATAALCLPWATHAWRIVITIRGRRPFHEDKHGTYHYFGLAEKVTKWDSPLVALTMLPYILLIKPLLSIALFLFVYVYVFLIRPILCLFALALASNLRLAVFPRIMNAIVTFVKEPPPILFGVRLEDIDPWDFDERMKRLRKTRGSAIACKWVRGEIPEYEERREIKSKKLADALAPPDGSDEIAKVEFTHKEWEDFRIGMTAREKALDAKHSLTCQGRTPWSLTSITSWHRTSTEACASGRWTRTSIMQHTDGT